MLTAVIQIGQDMPATQEYSYGRRAQAVTYTMKWKDAAIIRADTREEVIQEYEETVNEWGKNPNLRGLKFRLEGRGDLAHLLMTS